MLWRCPLQEITANLHSAGGPVGWTEFLDSIRASLLRKGSGMDLPSLLLLQEELLLLQFS